MTENKEYLISALDSIPVADLTRQEWIEVGMALRSEGFDCGIWDDWSRNDSRYKPGECAKKWNGFNGSGVTGGTIIHMAQERGWTAHSWTGDGAIGWDDWIEYDGAITTEATKMKPSEELIKYLETLFEPDEIVGYVTNDVWQDQDGAWKPGKGCFYKTAGEIIETLKAYPDDVGAAVGDSKPDAGAWIRFNPLDGQGVGNDNVTRFTYALVESDTLSVAEQDALYRKLELPISALASSGNKSLHAIVHVDAPDYEEYKKRVAFLYDFLKENGVDIDRQNKNPSRLSRMPGIKRGDNWQHLIDTNIGRKSWIDWMDFVDGVNDELPPIISMSEVKTRPPLAEDLICGVLRKGHKMLLAGPSKAGKSFALQELAICISEGEPWMGLNVRQGRVLYINLEIDDDSLKNRMFDIYEAGHGRNHDEDLNLWSLRGYAMTLDELIKKMERRVRGIHYDAVIIDPIYKVMMGDENNASDMGKFCNQFDRICQNIGASAIYVHHFAKGSQGGKKSIDRASGSGVFARDPDALLTMTELELTDTLRMQYADDGATGWRVEFTLREYAPRKPLDVWFRWPLHVPDESGRLAEMSIEGTPGAAGAAAGNSTELERMDMLEDAWDMCTAFGERSVPFEKFKAQLINKKTGKPYSDKTVRNWVEESEIFEIDGGRVFRTELL